MQELRWWKGAIRWIRLRVSGSSISDVTGGRVGDIGPMWMNVTLDFTPFCSSKEINVTGFERVGAMFRAKMDMIGDTHYGTAPSVLVASDTSRGAAMVEAALACLDARTPAVVPIGGADRKSVVAGKRV